MRAVAPEQRQAVYRDLEAACQQAHDCCFPAFGPWGDPRRPKLPPTPLYDETSREATRLEYGLPAPTPEELAAQARNAAEREQWKQRLAEKRRADAANQPWLADEEGILSPKIAATTQCPTTASAAPSLDKLAATPGEMLSPDAAADILSPKTEETTECDEATRLQRLEREAADLAWMVQAHCPESLHANDDFAHPDVDADPRVRIQLYQERLDRHKRRERQQARAAAKKTKAARKRAAAQRRRAA